MTKKTLAELGDPQLLWRVWEAHALGKAENKVEVPLQVEDLSIGTQKARSVIMKLCLFQMLVGVWVILDSFLLSFTYTQVTTILGGVGLILKNVKGFRGAKNLDKKHLGMYIVMNHFTLLLTITGAVTEFSLQRHACLLQAASFKEPGDVPDYCDGSQWSGIQANYFITILCIALPSVVTLHLAQSLRRRMKGASLMKLRNVIAQKHRSSLGMTESESEEYSNPVVAQGGPEEQRRQSAPERVPQYSPDAEARV